MINFHFPQFLGGAIPRGRRITGSELDENTDVIDIFANKEVSKINLQRLIAEQPFVMFIDTKT